MTVLRKIPFLVPVLAGALLFAPQSAHGDDAVVAPLLVGGDGCFLDSDCPEGACVDGQCSTDCFSDFDCQRSHGLDFVCELSTGTCYEEPPTPEELVAAACPCAEDWRNHGEYVRCVVTAVDDLAIETVPADSIVAEAARSDCGSP